MKYHKAWLLAASLLTIGASPALAADWGGVRDIGGGVPIPVPAPAPVPTFDADSDWYVGLALGGDYTQDAKIIEEAACGCTVSIDSGDTGTTPIFGLSFGRYITPSLRAEIAIDYNREGDLGSPTNPGYPYTFDKSAPGVIYTDPVTTIPTQTFDTSTYNVQRSDIVKLSRTTGLFNLIYDIDTGTRFTPYIGGGVGFSWRRMRRNYSDTATCSQTVNSSAGLAGGLDYPPGYCLNTTALPASSTTTGSAAKDQIDFAAAVQAGLAYQITDSITWDNGWQMLWEGNQIALTVPTSAGSDTVSYKNAVLQQFRTGLRFRFN